MSTTIQELIQTIIASVVDTPLKDTVDVIKIGDPHQPVSRIATTFLANRAVLEKAVAQGANLVITHEPIYYFHHDTTDWLTGDPVYEAKRQYCEEHNLVIWRFHDYWHMHQPDGILTGFLRQMGWESNAQVEKPFLVDLPPIRLDDLARLFKNKLDIHTVRVCGELDTACRRVSLVLGAAGGRWQIETLRNENVDVVVCGESNEWDTCEYIRDAGFAGQRKAMIILGHANSEESGMAYLVEWLQARFPGVPITHIPSGDPFHYV
jgi:putative NIF3 family GTP cyclohydrolase 1 type 2